jgi:cell division protein FtsI/penicillin-binding protein 2
MKSFLEVVKDSALAVYRFVTHRILWLLIVAAVAFYVLAARLFDLQIVNHDSFRLVPPKTNTVTVSTPAIRGSIYDAKGRPLAINNLSNAVKIEPSVTITNEGIAMLIDIFERNGEAYLDEFPMTKEEPYAFTFESDWQRNLWIGDMAINDPEVGIEAETARAARRGEGEAITLEEATPAQIFDFLRYKFEVGEGLTNAEARKILNIRCMLYKKRVIYIDEYNPTPITLATGVSDRTVAAIEENSDMFPGVYIDIQTTREYPEGKYFSHMLGYIREISEDELERNKDAGYSNTDLFGKAGLERSMERYLRGTSGSQTYEVNSAGRRQAGTFTQVVEAQPGDKIYLTIDAYLQRTAYDLLEKELAEALIGKINYRGNTRRDINYISMKQLYTSFVQSNNLPFDKVLASAEGGDAYTLKQYILERFPEANASEPESREQIKTIITEGIEAGRIHPGEILLTLFDIGYLSDPDGELTAKLRSNKNNTESITIAKIRVLELTPQAINLDPCTGSVVVVDNDTGDVLAAVTYPSYDNNRLVNIFDNAYYLQTFVYDPTEPFYYRTFNEALAPGSTMKMVSAAAVLEAGAITEGTRIYDEHSFTRANQPYTDCWSGISHGNINVRQALQVSCNYFFGEAAYRLGNARGYRTTNDTNAGIGILNKYLEYFGFNEKTGVEIGEYYDMFEGASYEGLTNYMSSPDYKRFITLMFNEDTPESDLRWQDGDTVRTAMGQAFSSYTPAMMARYIATIANRGVRYPLHLVQTIEASNGGVVMEYEPTPDTPDLQIADSTWDVLIDGMGMVTKRSGGLRGTAEADFVGFPVEIGGKTGTAQLYSYRGDHSSFAAFAPYDDPQISVYVNIPFGDTPAYSHVSAQVAREVIRETLGLNNTAEPPEAVNTLIE